MLPLPDRTAAFFETLRHKVDIQREASQHVDLHLSTGFNVFEYLSPNELVLSRILRDLLSPRGPHGQGTAFLDAFLQSIGSPDLVGADPIGVFTEWTTTRLPRSRRIDVVVQYADQVIGIENKPWAADQEYQVSDYQRALELAAGGRYRLIYLTSDGREPKDVYDRQRLKLLSYAFDVRAWLEECERQCKSDKFRWFLRDLNDYVQRAFPDGGAR